METNCGDPLLFEIIGEIKNAENVKLVSPSMESILQSKKKFQRLAYKYDDFYDSLSLSLQKGFSFSTAYYLPFGFMPDGKPLPLPKGFKTLKIVNGEILIYGGQNR